MKFIKNVEDKSLMILEKYALLDSRIKVIHKDNRGVSSARNEGIQYATGDYIAFIDSDDWVHKNYFDILMYHAMEYDTSITVANYKEKYDNDEIDKLVLPKKEIQVFNVNEAYSDAYLRNTVWGRLYKKEIVQDICFMEGIQYAEDAMFNITLFSKYEDIKIGKTEEKLYYYFNRSGSLVHLHNAYSYKVLCEKYLRLYMELYRKDLVIYQAIKMALLYRYEGLFAQNYYEIKKEVRPLLRRCFFYLYKEKKIPIIKKIKYSFLAISTRVYRIILLMQDRTYVEYEKLLKQQREQRCN